MARAAQPPAPVPEYVFQNYRQYAALNPSYDTDHADPRVIADLRQYFFHPETGEPLNHRQILRLLEVFNRRLLGKIRQMQENPVWHAKQGSTDAAFAAAPRTLPKTFQEVLTHPTERMVFSRDEASRPETLGAIIVDPARITDALLRNFGLEDFISAKGTAAVDRMASYAAAAASIHRTLETLEPIRLPHQKGMPAGQLKYFRLMRSEDGSVVGTQHTNGHKVLFKTDLYGASRRIHHIHAGYKAEIKTLQDIHDRLADVRDHLDDWQDIKQTDAVAVLTAELEGLAQGLRFVRDGEKQRILQHIKLSLTFHDRRGRLNPPAIQARLVKACRLVGARIEDISEISGYLGKDLQRVGALIEEEAKPLEDFAETVEALHTQFRILKGEPLDPISQRRVVTNLGILRTKLERCKFEPYRLFVMLMTAKIDAIIPYIEGKSIVSVTRDGVVQTQPQEAAHSFVHMYIVAKSARSYRHFQDIYEDISCNGSTIDLGLLKGKIDAAEAYLRQHSVAPEIRTKEFDEAFGRLYRLCNGLRKSLRRLIEPVSGVPDERAVVFEEMKNRLKKFRFQGWLDIREGATESV